jgi:hypothetical protein
VHDWPRVSKKPDLDLGHFLTQTLSAGLLSVPDCDFTGPGLGIIRCGTPLGLAPFPNCGKSPVSLLLDVATTQAPFEATSSQQGRVATSRSVRWTC